MTSANENITSLAQTNSTTILLLICDDRKNILLSWNVYHCWQSG